MRVTSVNQRYSQIPPPLIRLMKYWKELKWGDSISSYMFEQMILDRIESSQLPMPPTWQVRVLNVLGHLHSAIKNPVRDPKGIQGDLNELDQGLRNRLSYSALMSSLSAQQAIEFERNGETQKAINQWKLVFGDRFPDYRAY